MDDNLLLLELQTMPRVDINIWADAIPLFIKENLFVIEESNTKMMMQMQKIPKT